MNFWKVPCILTSLDPCPEPQVTLEEKLEPLGSFMASLRAASAVWFLHWVATGRWLSWDALPPLFPLPSCTGCEPLNYLLVLCLRGF